ncbi:MAG: hypothetical protein WC319_07645 [Candidatus Paceibacterota bacterium]|jgi:hypothetical protein
MRLLAEEQANLFIIQMSFEKVKIMDGAKSADLCKMLNAIHRAKMNLDFLLDECADSISGDLFDYFRDVKREIVKIEMKVMKERADESDRNNRNSAHDDMAK